MARQRAQCKERTRSQLYKGRLKVGVVENPQEHGESVDEEKVSAVYLILYTELKYKGFLIYVKSQT